MADVESSGKQNLSEILVSGTLIQTYDWSPTREIVPRFVDPFPGTFVTQTDWLLR